MAGNNVLGSGVIALPTPNSGADDARSQTLDRFGNQLFARANQVYVGGERGYMVSNPTRNTALAAGGTSFSDTAPAFSLDVAAGTTMRNLNIRLRQGGTVAGGVITVILAVDAVARYSSSGTAITVRNMKMGAGITHTARRNSGVSAYSNPTLSAVNTAMTLYSTILSPDVGAGTIVNSPQAVFEYPVLPEYELIPELVGPASVQIYTFAASTQPSWFFSFKWVEVDS